MSALILEKLQTKLQDVLHVFKKAANRQSENDIVPVLLRESNNPTEGSRKAPRGV